jgi:regulator of protease activity HflC (stomatin/prohibitin superfamily)
MIRDVDLPATVDVAIEAKKAAEQQVITANFTRQRSLIEADADRQVMEIQAAGTRNATIIEANGSAEAVRIVVEQLKAADPNMNNTIEAYLTWLYTQALTDTDSNIQYIIVTDGTGTPILLDLNGNETEV